MGALSKRHTPMKLRLIFTLLLAASALGAGGCATTSPPRRPDPPPAEAPYPAWTKAAGWLALPFTGANGSVSF